MKRRKKRRKTTKAFPYQRIGIAKIEWFGGRCLLADEMGLGKSFQAARWAKKFMKPGTIVIVCPASIKYNWEDEIRKHLDRTSEVLNGRKLVRINAFFKKHPILIINYDILEAWLPALKEVKPRLVIIDEVQYIKNPWTKRCRAVQELCSGVYHVIGLGGTGGLEKEPIELWPILNIIRPDKFPSRTRFGNRYCRPEYTRWGVKFTGGTRLDELNRRLKKICMVRRRVDDVLKDLPEQVRIPVVLTLPNGGLAEYKSAEKDFLKWLRKTHPDRLAAARRAERLVRVMYLKRLAAQLKMPAVEEWIENFAEETDHKLLVFGVHKFVVQGLAHRFPDCVRVDGSVTHRKRHEAFTRFNTRKKVRWFFGNLEAAGVGWSCRSASDVAFVELGWTPGKHLQAEKRVRGIGRGVKGRKSRAFYLVAKGTIEEKILEILQERQKMVDAVLDGGKVIDKFNILDQLEEQMLEDG